MPSKEESKEPVKTTFEYLSLMLSVGALVFSPFVTYAVASAVNGEQITSLKGQMEDLKASKDKIEDALESIKNTTADIRDRLSKLEGYLDKSRT